MFLFILFCLIRFYFQCEWPGFALHRFTISILAFGSVRCGLQQIKQEEAWNQSIFLRIFSSLSFFFKRRIVFTCCSPCMSSAAILFCIYHTLLSLLILLSLTFGRFVLELKQPLSFLETFRRVFISRCYCHENSKRQQINKMNKLNHLNLIVY